MKKETFERNGKQVIKLKIQELKEKLKNTDYMAIKYAESEIGIIEYEPIREQRRAWREEINRLEQELQDK